jgi:eukaryotic-like serine/threonine-protein kinase
MNEPKPSQPSAIAFDPNVAHNLVDTVLPDGWRLIRKTRASGFNPDESGGNFSVGYIGERNGKEAFVKVFDLGGVLVRHAGNIMKAMMRLGQEHQYECQLLDICQASKLDRVVSVLARGQVDIPGPNGLATPVPYIVFEKADCDIRKALAKTDAIEDAWRFKMLHHVAVGLSQLHGKQIAHQDLKPSNVLIFDSTNEGAKIGDLGRASRNDGTRAGHDGLTFAGDGNYAPPEQAYGVVAPEWRDRREGCDVYHLGCLAAFVFTGVTPNAHYLRLPEEIRPRVWGGTWTGTYDEVVPFISAAFADYLQRVKHDFPAWAAEELVMIVRQMCDPYFERRGDPEARSQVGSPLGLDRFVSRFDRLAKSAQVKAKAA